MYFKAIHNRLPTYRIKALSKANAAEKLAKILYSTPVAVVHNFGILRITKDEFEFARDAMSRKHSGDETVWW
jgi:hypothetical protein